MALNELDKTINTLCDRVQKLLSRHAAYPRERVLIALAGVPGSGKTTVSSAVMERLRSRGVGRIMVAPMVRYPRLMISATERTISVC